MKRPTQRSAQVLLHRPSGDRADLKTRVGASERGLPRGNVPHVDRGKISGTLVSATPRQMATPDRDPAAGYWRRVGIPESRDIRRLAPPSLPRNKRFETKADVKARKEKLIKILERREPDIAEGLHNCAPFASRCLLPGCPACSRLYRGYLVSETMRINALPLAGPREFVTVCLKTIPAGSLSRVSIKDEHLKFRKRLERLGFQGFLIGGTEVAWKAAERVWVLHLHILAIGVDPAAWEQLRKNMGNTGRAIPLRREPLRDAVRPVSYLQKFVTLHRPGRRVGGKPATAYPLKDPQVAELCRWWANHRLEDFMFLLRARRRGARIEPEAGRQDVGLVGSPRVIFSKTLSVVSGLRDVTVRVDYREEISIQDEE